MIDMDTFEKKYDEALERARKLKEMYPQDAPGYEEVFPELVESEDERIRKGIVETIKQCPDTFLNPKNRDAMLTYLEKQKEQIPYIDFVIKPHKGYDNNPYDMQVSEAQEYAIKRGFGIPFNDGEVYVDERHMTQTIGNILRWADEHPKEQKPILSDRDFTDFEIEVHEIIAQARNDSRLDDADVLKQFEEEAAFALMLKANKLIEQKPSWSEEDETMVKCIVCCLDGQFVPEAARKQSLKWFNEHRRDFLNSPSWKPSEEQMEALYTMICECMPADQQLLQDIYYGLKKLM